MIPRISLRRLVPPDLPFADSLRALAGWNQTLADWERFLAFEPGGCFLAEVDRQPAGTITAICYGRELAWLGMLLVHPGFRGQGVGRALMEAGLGYIQGKGVQCIKLDATPAGRPLYEKLRFREEWPLSRWEGELPARVTSHEGTGPVTDWRNVPFERIVALDERAFGARRPELLRDLARGAMAGCALADGSHLFLRRGSRAVYLGPLSATSVDAARLLLRRVLLDCPGASIFWDIPAPNDPARSLARSLGFSEQRPLTRMFLGPNSSPGQTHLQFAIAGPDLG